MAAGLGFKTFTTGEVLTAADTNGYLMQGILVFASSAARASAVTSPQEGQYSYLKDTNALEYYDGAAWVGAPVGDITAVTAGKGLTGGGSSGDVTVSLGTTAKGDLVAGSGASTAAVLTVGANNTVLTADSAAATGLKWATATPSYAWTTWSPTLTGITAGNGTTTARYVQIDKLVVAQFDFTLGSTSAITGAIEITLPVTAKNTNYCASGLLIDGGASYYATNIVPLSTTKLWMLAAYASPYVYSLNINSTTPYTWTTTDQIKFTVSYEAA